LKINIWFWSPLFFCWKELNLKDLVSISYIFFFCGLEQSRSRKRKASELWQKFSGLEHLEDNNDKNAALKIILVVVPLKSPHTPRQKAASMKGT
jgi:hypothetical protein